MTETDASAARVSSPPAPQLACAGPDPFPWADAMAFGLGVLRLSPVQFWQMTPRELAAAVEGLGAGKKSAPVREQLRTLMRAFPDAQYQEQPDSQENRP